MSMIHNEVECIMIYIFNIQKMQKKVDAILTIIKNSYKQCADVFHEYFVKFTEFSVIIEKGLYFLNIMC